MLAERNDVASAEGNGLREVGGGTHALAIAIDSDREGRTGGELANHGKGRIVRTVVDNYNLVREAGLSKQAGPLGSKESLPVTGAQSNRDSSQ